MPGTFQNLPSNDRVYQALQPSTLCVSASTHTLDSLALLSRRAPLDLSVSLKITLSSLTLSSPSSLSLSSNNLRELLKIGRAQARRRIPSGNRGEADLIVRIIHALGHIVEALGVLVQEGVQEAERLAALCEADAVEAGDDAADDGRRGRGF